MAKLIVALRGGTTLNFASGISVLMHPGAVRTLDVAVCMFVIYHVRFLHVVEFMLPSYDVACSNCAVRLLVFV